MIVSLLSVFLLLNIVIAERSSQVWVDEALLTDPAMNLFSGNGFTSTAWYYQTRDQFWASNAPLHPFLLAGWLHLWGFSIRSVRSFNYTSYVLAVLGIWIAVRKLGLVRGSIGRIGLVVLLLLGQGVSSSYLSGRYDCLAVLLFTLLALAWSIENSTRRALALAGGAALLPAAGLHLLPYAAVVGVVLCVSPGRRVWADVASVMAGLVLGLAGLFVFLHAHDVAQVLFVRSAGGHMLGGTISSGTISEASDSEKTRYVLGHLPEIVWKRISNVAGWFFRDVSSAALSLLLACIALDRTIPKSTARVARAALAMAAGSVLVLGILRDFPIYYSWMAYVPLCIGVAAAVSETPWDGSAGWRRAVSALLLVTASLAGFPRFLADTIRFWDQRDYKPVTAFVAQVTRPGDHLYSDFLPYYALKAAGRDAVFPTYLDVITQQEKLCINVILRNQLETAPSKDVGQVIRVLGGDWVETGEHLSNSVWDLRVYRRKDPSPCEG